MRTLNEGTGHGANVVTVAKSDVPLLRDATWIERKARQRQICAGREVLPVRASKQEPDDQVRREQEREKQPKKIDSFGCSK